MLAVVAFMNYYSSISDHGLSIKKSVTNISDNQKFSDNGKMALKLGIRQTSC